MLIQYWQLSSSCLSAHEHAYTDGLNQIVASMDV